MENAIEEDHDGIAEQILEEELDPNSHVTKSAWNDTLLHWAARYNAFECTKVSLTFPGIKKSCKNRFSFNLVLMSSSSMTLTRLLSITVDCSVPLKPQK